MDSYSGSNLQYFWKKKLFVDIARQVIVENVQFETPYIATLPFWMGDSRFERLSPVFPFDLEISRFERNMSKF